jgi:hypothetical protein
LAAWHPTDFMSATMPDNHQDLLEQWYIAEKKVLSEWSGDIAKDTRKLHEKATSYAHKNGLVFDIEIDEWHREDWDDA